MHSAVLQNKKYIKFASQNTVEVMVMSGLEGGIQKKDRKAATYESVDESGKKVEYLVEFPGMRVEDITGMTRTKAASYNDTGSIPHTAFVDPFTLEKLEGIKGGASAGQVTDAAEAAMKIIRKQNGKAEFSRKDIAKIDSAAAKVQKELGRSRLDKALSAVRKLEKSAKSWPELAQGRVAKIKQVVLDAASAQIDEYEKLGESNPRMAKTKLAVLGGRLKGTELEARVKDLIAKMIAAIGAK